MKNTENNNKKHTIAAIGGLCLLCVTVLAATFLLKKEPENKFTVPATIAPSNVAGTWNDTSDSKTPTPTTLPVQESSQTEGGAEDQTQILISKDDTGTTTKLSDSISKEDTPSEKPKDKPTTTDDLHNPDKMPEYSPTTAPAPSDAPQPTNTPVPTYAVPSATPVPTDVPKPTDASAPKPTDAPVPTNSDNEHPGQVYDPVFGWIPSGETTQTPADSTGDINKQVGTMGGN